MDTTEEIQQAVSGNKSSDISTLLKLSEEYLALGIYDRASSCLKEALLLGKCDLEVYKRLGFINYCQHEYQIALECYQMALDLSVDDADVINSIGLLYLAIAEYEIAETYFLEAVKYPETKSKACLSLARLSLAAENYDKGWEYYQRSGSSTDDEIITQESLTGKSILIYGDISSWQEMFFFRFLMELAKKKPKRISYFASDDLQILFRKGIEGVDIVRTLPTNTKYDLIISILELPGILSKLQNLSHLKPIDFDFPTKLSLKIVKNLLPNNRRENIAVVWESFNPEIDGLIMRMSPELLGDALRYTEANILVLQKNASSKDIRLLEKGLRRKVFNYGFISESIESSLAFLTEVDHYISVGDDNIHLVSGLNTRVSILASHPPQWQWLIDVTESPWFPNFQIHRQDASGCWDQACQELKTSLHAFPKLLY